MNLFTLIWTISAEERLAELWVDNPLIRADINIACREIEQRLRQSPVEAGMPASERSRLIVHPPLAILFRVLPMDRQVRIIHVAFWDD